MKKSKPVECKYGMLKQRFSILKEEIKINHEDYVVLFIFSCVFRHNVSIGKEDMVDVYLQPDKVQDQIAVIISEVKAGKSNFAFQYS